ncbi:MAG TPA: lipopolysaccharide heptosyltransferase II [Desulfuromonadales bacterium]|nr:lipopolysaccharide heptosyltransferase II [Desulfuromonadales bacterium]
MVHEKERKRILVLRYRFIGDTILTIPFLRNLRRAEPDAYIAWVVAPGSSEVVSGIPYVDEFISWDPVTIHADSQGTHRTFGDKLSFIRALRSKRFDTVYVLKRSFGSALMGFLSGARQRIGFATEGRSFLLTKTVPYRHDQHEVQNFLDVLRADGILVIDDYLEAWLSSEERQFADRFFEEAGVAPGELVIGIHPFAANPPRAWHLDNFIELAGKIQELYGARILFFGGPKDLEALPTIRSAMKHQALEAVGCTSLRQSMALLSRCQLLVCNDSGIMHLAASLRVPLIALFGPQSPLKFGPWGEKCRVVSQQFPCSPCKQIFFSECEPSPRGRPECLEAISVEMVIKEIDSIDIIRVNKQNDYKSGKHN